jgi:hypothetical protein
MAAHRLTIVGFLSKVILSTFGLLFLFAGPGRQVVAYHAAQFADQAGAATRRSASQAAAIVGPAADGLAAGGLVMEPGQWFVTGHTTINGMTMPAGSLSRCFTYGKVREIMATA